MARMRGCMGLGALLLAACGSPQPAPELVEGREVPFTTIARAFHGGGRDMQRAVHRRDEWLDLVNGGMVKSEREIGVDFGKEIVVVIVALSRHGQCPLITKIVETRDGIRVLWRADAPENPRTACSDDPCLPFHVIKLDNPRGGVEFRREP